MTDEQLVGPVHDDPIEKVGMTPDELVRLGEQAFGKSWKSVLATELQVYVSTVNRWVTGYTPISRQTEFAIRHLVERQDSKKVA